MRTRVLLFSDPHCGHVAGLASPDWRVSDKQWPGWQAARKEAWKRWLAIHEKYGPYDAALFAADGIDGRGEKDGGAEVVIPDQMQQAECLTEVLESVPFRRRRRRMAAVFGTPYHVGKCESYERLAYDAVGIPRNLQGDAVQAEICGKLFDLRHDIQGSGSPTGGDVSLRKEVVTDELWVGQHDGRKADVYVRGHVHYGRCLMDAAGWYSATVPSLQLWTRFGARRVHGRVIHWGVWVVDIDSEGDMTWRKVVVKLSSFRGHKVPTMV